MQIEVIMKRTQYASAVIDWDDDLGFEPLYRTPDTVGTTIVDSVWDGPRTVYEVLAVDPVSVKAKGH